MRAASYALSLAAFAAAFVASAACSGPQAGIAEFSSGGVSASSGDDDSTNSTSSSSTSGSTGDTTTQAIFGNDAFAYKQPAENADDHNTGTHAGLVPMEGRGCVVTGCHAGGTTPWAAAGTVYNSDGTTFTGQAEIGIVTPDNKGIPIFTDKEGNFFTPGAPVPEGSKVGIRTSSGKTLVMNKALPAPPASANCNATGGCHGDATNRIVSQ